jgi:parallel beta-helix repeat protein
VRSDFVRNYFGAYSFEARNVQWIANRFLDNTIYGLDPHDESNGFLVAHNFASGNGRHGIIFSRLCDHNVIRDNVSVHNHWHGIVLDDGKRGDGPSIDNRVYDNDVADNGKVGISIDGSGDNRVYGNRVSGQPIGIRLFGRSLGDVISGNRVTDSGIIGIFVDAPSSTNAIVANRVSGAPTAVKIRGASSTLVRGNDLAGAHGHGVTVTASRGHAARNVVIDDNTIAGSGTSPVFVPQHGGVQERRNDVTWNYPLAHDAARALAWVVGPGVWVLIFGIALLGPALFGIGGLSGAVRGVGGAGAFAGAIVLFFVVTAPGGPRAEVAGAVVLRPPADPRLRVDHDLVPSAGPVAMRTVSQLGHPSHPTWYHDSQVVARGDEFIVAWNGQREVRAARLRASDLAVLEKKRLNRAPLGGATDTTGTDTDRHDVPTVVADAAGGVHFVYGGGSVAAQSPGQGPYTRDLPPGAGLGALSDERTLATSPGSAFDFQAVTDHAGVRHLIGQAGRGNTGSLVDLRMSPDGRWLPARQIVAGGYRPDGCVVNGRAQGCNRFAIGRMTADDRGRLELVWGYSENSLGGRCRSDAGYCDHDLSYAYSADGGETWRNATSTAAVRLAPGRSIAPEDSRFRVATGHIGLFKAVTTDAAGPLLIGTEWHGDKAELVAWRSVAGRWAGTTIARAGDGGVDSWNGALVVRHDAGGFTLWTCTGNAIFRFSSRDGVDWQRVLAYKGPAWSLTGARAPARGLEIVMWRGAVHGKHSDVVAALLPAGATSSAAAATRRGGRPAARSPQPGSR